MRVVGLDLGSRRIGVAVSDPSGALASPRSVYTRTGDADADRHALAAIVQEEGAGLVVVGLPLSLDGRGREPAAAARDEAAALAEVLDVQVELHDERLTTVLAARLRREGGGGAAGGSGGGRRRRGARAATRTPIDAEAAAVMLQSWLDSRRQLPPSS